MAVTVERAWMTVTAGMAGVSETTPTAKATTTKVERSDGQPHEESSPQTGQTYDPQRSRR
jgi:hypothetical protein